MSIEAWALIASVLIAGSGYLATHVNDALAQRRGARLQFVNEQLTSFYGPLYVVSVVGRTAYEALVQKLGRQNDPNLDESLSETEFSEWRLWTTQVFMPMNEWCEQLLLRNAHLVRESQMPACILQFITHVSAFKAVVKKWDQGDFSERFSLIEFPDDLASYAKRAYRELKATQQKLIGQVQGGA